MLDTDLWDEFGHFFDDVSQHRSQVGKFISLTRLNISSVLGLVS